MTPPPTFSEPAKLFHGLSVLIAEDSKIFRGIYEIYLSELGCTLSFVTNGWEALEYLKYQAPNVILLDMDMPEMDGPTFLRYFCRSSSYKRIPVVIASSREPEQVEPTALSVANGYLKKPFGPSKLREVLQSTLRAAGAIAPI